ncbi:ABC transporter E family member 2 [Tanacetum coccineum]
MEQLVRSLDALESFTNKDGAPFHQLQLYLLGGSFPLIWRSAIKRTLDKATYSPTSRLDSWKLSISMPSGAIIKPQYVDHIPKAVQGNVGQRFAIAVVAIQMAEIYMFDEPSSYLDVKQRLKAAQVNRSLLRPNSYVIVVEHDLSVLDYLSDFICCLYGKPGAYGVVTLPFSVREGINIFLDGFVPTENLRFREIALTFRVSETTQESAEEIETYAQYRYPTMSKTQGGFKLKAVEGEFTDSQIIVMLGENGTGKTTFIRMLAGLLKPDTVEGSEVEIPEHLLHSKIRDSYMHPQFVSDVMKPLQIEQLMDQEVVNLSGGELQRVALTLTAPADIYLIDEPSAYLDSEQRIVASKVIKRFILHAKKTAFVVEHDFIMATYLADRVIVYEGQPSVNCVANAPQSLLTEMNLSLSVFREKRVVCCLKALEKASKSQAVIDAIGEPIACCGLGSGIFQLRAVRNAVTNLTPCSTIIINDIRFPS